MNMESYRSAALPLLVGVSMALAACCSLAQEMGSAMIPTAFVEDGKELSLEVVFRRPPGPGPFPTLIFTHGSVSNGNDAREVTHTVIYPALADYFIEKGWMVAFVQRRGRGKSGGKYLEGWDTKLGRYACDLEIAETGRQRGLEDLDAVWDALSRNPLVDASRLLIGGNSRGGALALIHASKHPTRYVGAINFVGGWAGKRCSLMAEINAQAFAQAGGFPKPTLWLYGERDWFYGIEESRPFFDTFVGAGGKGEFHSLTYGPLRSDHQIVQSRPLWDRVLSNYLDQTAGH
jgi:pimeloyl-ACP methyl ester carboxylesterase